MLESAIIHRPGMVGDRVDVGRVLETMLYYDRVHLVISGDFFRSLWEQLGPDDMQVLLDHPVITSTITPEMLAVHTSTHNGIESHRPVAFRFSGDAGHVLADNDETGYFLELVKRTADLGSANRGRVNRLLKHRKVSRYEKILGSKNTFDNRFASLAKDEQTLKIFTRGWAIAQGGKVDEAALARARIEAMDIGNEVMISASVPIDRLITGTVEVPTWAQVLAAMQDYSVDLYLSNVYSADIVTTRNVAEIASERVDLSLKRAARSAEQITAFQEMVFDEAHAFAEAFNKGFITFSEALKIIDQSRKFRGWSRSLAPDANLIAEYHRAISQDTLLGKLPASVARFAMFNGTAAAADVMIAPGTGLLLSAIDSFIVEKVAGGWRPNVFVRNVRKALDKAKSRANN